MTSSLREPKKRSRYSGWRETGDRIQVGGENFPHRSTPAFGSTHSASCTMGAGIISRGVEWSGAVVALTTHSI